MCNFLSVGETITDVNENLRLIQKKDGLTFGTDAYMLAAFIRVEPSAVSAELGSGTGIISMLVSSKNKLSHIDAFEIQPEFVDVGERNIKLNRLDDRITQYNHDIRELDPSFFGKYDVVFANPPYMKTGNGKSCASNMKNIARHEESGGIYEFASAAAKMLKYGGKFYTVYRPDRLSDLISALQKNKLEPKRMTFIYPDTESSPSAVLTEAKSGASVGITVTPPVIIYDSPIAHGQRQMTEKTRSIYDNCMI